MERQTDRQIDYIYNTEIESNFSKDCSNEPEKSIEKSSRILKIDAFTDYESPKLPHISFKTKKNTLTKKQTAKLQSLAFYLEHVANNSNNQNYSNFLKLQSIFSDFVLSIS